MLIEQDDPVENVKPEQTIQQARIVGHLDDIVIVPGLILIALWLIPEEVLDECASRSHSRCLSLVNGSARVGHMEGAIMPRR